MKIKILIKENSEYSNFNLLKSFFQSYEEIFQNFSNLVSQNVQKNEEYSEINEGDYQNLFSLIENDKSFEKIKRAASMEYSFQDTNPAAYIKINENGTIDFSEYFSILKRITQSMKNVEQYDGFEKFCILFRTTYLPFFRKEKILIKNKEHRLDRNYTLQIASELIKDIHTELKKYFPLFIKEVENKNINAQYIKNQEDYEIFNTLVSPLENLLKLNKNTFINKFSYLISEFYLNDIFGNDENISKQFVKRNYNTIVNNLQQMLKRDEILIFKQLNKKDKKSKISNKSSKIFNNIEQAFEKLSQKEYKITQSIINSIFVDRKIEDYSSDFTTETGQTVHVVMKDIENPELGLKTINEFYKICEQRGFTEGIMSKINGITFVSKIEKIGKVENPSGYYNPSGTNRNHIVMRLKPKENKKHILKTLVHEFGHLIHYNSHPEALGYWRDNIMKPGSGVPHIPNKVRYIKDKYDPRIEKPEELPTDYSRTNILESFAVVFEKYILTPQELHKNTLHKIRRFLSLSNFYGDSTKTHIHEIKILFENNSNKKHIKRKI